MKNSLCWAALVVLLSLSANSPQVVAQGQPGVAQPMAGPRIALIDVTHIFKNHIRFKGMMGDMKNDVKKAESWVKGERIAVGKLAERLQEFNKGTPDYKAMKEEVARRQADLSVKVQLQRNEFLEREAKIYYTVYQEIWQATDYFARQPNIDIVFRFNGNEVNPDLPQEVLSNINKQVVWYDRGLNITDAILKELNRTAINPAAADRRGTAAPRQTVPFGNKR